MKNIKDYTDFINEGDPKDDHTDKGGMAVIKVDKVPKGEIFCLWDDKKNDLMLLPNREMTDKFEPLYFPNVNRLLASSIIKILHDSPPEEWGHILNHNSVSFSTDPQHFGQRDDETEEEYNARVKNHKEPPTNLKNDGPNGPNAKPYTGE